MNEFDTVVIGLGCAGISACSSLARRGQDVLGVDKGSLVNELGSSHGDIRLFRFAYHEGEAYVPLLYESLDRWFQLEQYCGEPVFDQIGSATIGRESSEKVAAARETCESCNISYDMWSGDEFSEVFQMWSLPSEFSVLYQRDGGVLHSRNGIEALAMEAEDAGAEIQTGRKVVSWESDSDGVTVEFIDGSVVSASSLVVTTGPWAEQVDELSNLLTVERHCVGFFEFDSPWFSSPGSPVWVFDGGPDERFYGAPSVYGEVKLGKVSGDTSASVASLRREWDVYELLPEISFIRSYFAENPSSVRGEVCPLTQSPDGHFIIDSSELYENVYYGVGLSGHGLKLAPAIGRLVADCVCDGVTEEMFSLGRFD